jgi:hypothetical protein
MNIICIPLSLRFCLKFALCASRLTKLYVNFQGISSMQKKKILMFSLLRLRR